MAPPKPTPKNLTEEDRLQMDEALMTKLRISHHSDTTSESWPTHLKNTFHQIDALGQYRYESYDDGTPAQHSMATWRRKIKLRAKQLSDTARRLLGDKPSELTWRLELEGLVDARFSLRTECETCSGPNRSGRLWRSEIEVVSEVEGSISKDLKARQERRVPCQCVNEGYSGLNPLFSNRADQVFSYDPHLEEELEKSGSGNGPKGKGIKLPERRPDRVYGLRQTPNFEERLSSPAKTVLDGASGDAITALLGIVDAGEEQLVQDFIHATPFHQRGDPLLFPFLILEAKSEDGRGHRNCGVQTSLPIWAVLNAQERLREYSDNLDEVGGPFIWYIHYLGDSWRVSGCYTAIEKGNRVYRIQDLWNGRISSPDGALRVLLIIDYIFDWARDLYRTSILLCLRAMSCGLDDSMSLAADSDINSTRRAFRQEENSEMESTLDSGFLDAPADDESLLDPWKNFDIRRQHAVTDWNWLAFRPSYIIKSSFQCLYLTRDNMRSFTDCLGESHSKLEKIVLQPLVSGCHPIQSVVREIYKRHKASGRLVPDAPCLRFSAQLERLDKHILIDDYSITLPLDSRQPLPEIPAHGMILIYDKKRSDRHLCIYIIQEYDDLPQLNDLTSAIATVLSEERYFALDQFTWVNNENSASYGFYDPIMQPGDKVMPLIRVAAQRWGEDLLRKFDKDFEKTALPEAFKYSEESYLELRNLTYDCPFSGDPEHTRLHKKLRVATYARKRILQQRGGQLSTARIEAQNAEIQALLEKMGRDRFQNAVIDVLAESNH